MGSPRPRDFDLSLYFSPFFFDSGPIRISASSSDERRGGFSNSSMQIVPIEGRIAKRANQQQQQQQQQNNQKSDPQALQAPRCRPAARTAGAKRTALPAAGGAPTAQCGAVRGRGSGPAPPPVRAAKRRAWL